MIITILREWAKIIIIIQTTMKHVRSLPKHYPITTIQSPSPSSSSFSLKGIGQCWVELHGSTGMEDAISVPEELRMARLWALMGGDNGIVYVFQNDNRLWAGVADQSNLFIQGSWINTTTSSPTNTITTSPTNTDISIRITNPAPLYDSSTICYLSLDSRNKSYLNILSCFVQSPSTLTSTHTSYPLSTPMSPSTNLSVCPSACCLFYVSNSQGVESLICYSLQKQSVSAQMELPDINAQNGTRCQLLPTRAGSPCSSQVVCCYGQEYLTLVDTRMGGLIAVENVYRSEAAQCVYGNTGPLVYYSKQNCIYEYNLYQGKTSRIPLLTHSQPISNFTIQGGMARVEDTNFCGVHLYDSQ